MPITNEGPSNPTGSYDELQGHDPAAEEDADSQAEPFGHEPAAAPEPEPAPAPQPAQPAPKASS